MPSLHHKGPEWSKDYLKQQALDEDHEELSLSNTSKFGLQQSSEYPRGLT